MEHSFDDMVRYYWGYDNEKKQWCKCTYIKYLYFSKCGSNKKLWDVIVEPVDTSSLEYDFYINTDKSER